MKLIAKQVNPEFQESTLFISDETFSDETFPDDICIWGNRDYNTHMPDYALDALDVLVQGDLYNELQSIENESATAYYKTATEAITDMLPPVYPREEYNARHIRDIKRIIYNYEAGKCNQEQGFVMLLSSVTGRQWSYKTIHGCCQGDWQYIASPVDDWSRERLRNFEIEYFNLGAEWKVYEDGADADDCLYVYTHSYSTGKTKKEIAETWGNCDATVTLFRFTGYTRTPNYEEV